MLFRAVPHSRHAVRRYVLRLKRVPKPEPVRSALRLSLCEREEISRGSRLASRCGRSRRGWVGRRRRSRARSHERRPASLSGVAGGSGGAAADATTEAGEARHRAHGCARRWRPSSRERWSPQQISGWLVETFPDDPEMRVSHETIYLSLYRAVPGCVTQGTGPLSAPRAWQPPTARPTRASNGQGQLGGTLNIRERPAEAERPRRARPLGRRPADGQTHARDGDAGRTQDPLRDADRVARTGTPPTSSPTRSPPRSSSSPNSSADRSPGTKAKRWPTTRGSASKTGVPVYFCDPRSPWQRGSNENTNGLLRQYFPKRTEIAHYTQADLDAVAAQLNGRPRQTLGWKTPSQALDAALR